MKPSRTRSRSIAFSLVAFSGLVTLPALAQDGPAPPVVEPSNPAPASPAPADAASATPPADGSSDGDDSAAPKADAPAEPAATLAPLEQKKAATTTAAPASVDEVEEPDDGELHHHQDHWLAFAGFRVGSVKSSGYDPFADSDELVQFSLGLGRTLMTSGKFSIAGLFLYDIGGRSGEARGAESDLTVHRLTLGGEGRYHFLRPLYVFGRVAPGAIHSIAKIADPSVGVDTRAARTWVFATDLSAGATFAFSGWSGSQKKRHVNAWITLEGGYGFATESELSLTADGDQGPERSEPVDLGPLALSGPFLRTALVLTY